MTRGRLVPLLGKNAVSDPIAMVTGLALLEYLQLHCSCPHLTVMQKCYHYVIMGHRLSPWSPNLRQRKV